jgi:xylulokinase
MKAGRLLANAARPTAGKATGRFIRGRETPVSPAANCLMGIDSGTQSTTVCVWTPSGRRVARASAPLAVRTPRPGWAEQDGRSWWSSTRRAVGEALRHVSAARIAAVGLAYQRETFGLLGRRERFLRPGILWLDVRSTDEVEAIAAKVGRKRYHRLTGKPLDVTSAAARLLWLRRHEPQSLDATATWADVGACIARKLTGRFATCVAGTDTCGLISLRRRDWIEPLLRFVGLRRGQMPELVDPGDVIGRVSRAASAATGLPEGLPVVAAGGDGQVFGVGVGAARPYRASLSLGTSIVLGLPSPRAVTSPFCRTLIAPASRYLLESVLQAGTFLLRWFTNRFGPRPDATEADWDRQAARIPPGCEGLLTLPNWWGVRFPRTLPDVRGATLGWSNHHTMGHFYRSLLEGLSFELRRLVGELRAALPRRVRRTIRAGGGGARSRVWPQMLAHVLDCSIETTPETEATALGAAILAGVGVGLFRDIPAACAAMCRRKQRFSPDRRKVRLYGRLYDEVYLPLFSATAGLSQALRRTCRPDGPAAAT